jgi:hexosaminidase
MTGIIPQIQSVKLNEGTFTLTGKSPIQVTHDSLESSSALLSEYASDLTGTPSGKVTLALKGTPVDHEMGFPDESYVIEIGPEALNITAPDKAGIARAVQTVRQIAGIHGTNLPCCIISDSPRLPWRGMHLDVSRHFFSKEDVLKFIDTIALYRMNKLHLHLTDDQGWRVEIKKYPKLTEIGSIRECTIKGHAGKAPRRYDNTPHGGFYTQEDIKEMVTYAKEREIDIIPEIDMPGHMQAAIAAYPELGCTDMTLKPLCMWGISQHILNVNESTIAFMKNVLDEIMDIFPYSYVHVGGDEAHKYEWVEQRHVQDRMAELGLEGEDELQSWFITQMGNHIQSRGRKMIGWDEILEGGLADGAIVMSWRGEKGGIEAAKKGAPVINCTNTHCYFDYYQGDKKGEPLAIGGDLRLEKVYSFEPVPSEIPENKKHLIMGSQGQLWSEYLPVYSHVEYMAFPRAIALAECLWNRPEEKDWKSFRTRLKENLSLLDKLGVNYRPLD